MTSQTKWILFFMLFLPRFVFSETVTIKRPDGTVIVFSGNEIPDNSNTTNNTTPKPVETGGTNGTPKTDGQVTNADNGNSPKKDSTNSTDATKTETVPSVFSVDCEKTIKDAKEAALRLRDKHKKALIARHAISKLRILASMRSYYSFGDIGKMHPLERDDLKKLDAEIIELKGRLTSEANEEIKKFIEGNILAKEKEYKSIFLSNAWNAISSANTFGLAKDHPNLSLDSFDKNYFFSYFRDRPEAFGKQRATGSNFKEDLGKIIDDFSINHNIDLETDSNDLDILAPIVVGDGGKVILDKSLDEALAKVMLNNKVAHDLSESIYKTMNKQLAENTKACVSFSNNSVYECKLGYYDHGKFENELDPIEDIFRYFLENSEMNEPDLECSSKEKAEIGGLNIDNWKVVNYNCFCGAGDDTCCLTVKGYTYSKDLKTCIQTLACTGANEIKVAMKNGKAPSSCSCEKGYRWNGIDKKCQEFSKCEALESDAYALDFWISGTDNCSCSKDDDSCCNADGDDGRSYYFSGGKCIARSFGGNIENNSSSTINIEYDFDITIKALPPRFEPIMLRGEGAIMLMPGQL